MRRAIYNPRTGDREIKRDAFADLVAEHGDRNRASNELGISASYGRVLWAEIIRGLGWQAR